MTKILVDKAVIEQALEALEDCECSWKQFEAIAACEEALEQPVSQEPVAWLWCKNGKPQSALLHKPTTFPQDSYWKNKGFSAQPLYAASVSTKDLSDDEIEEIFAEYGTIPHTKAVRAIIEKFKEKNQ